MVWLETWLYYYLIIVAIVLTVDATILWCGNVKFRYYACYLGYMATTSVIAPLYLPLLPLMSFGSNKNIYFITIPGKILSKILGIKWEIRGLEHLDGSGPAMVTASHQTMFDILGLFVLGTALRNIVVVARNALFYVLPLGPIFWLSRGVVFIDNTPKANRTIETLSKVLCRVKNNKMKMIFFPEGTRNLNGNNLLPFKKGAFVLAIQAQLPIVPLVFSPYYLIDHQKRIFRKGKVIISVLPPIKTEGATILDLKLLVEKTQNVMEAEFQKLKLEMETENSNFIMNR